MARQAKDITKRLRFHLFPRPDTFRGRFFLVGLLAAAAGLALWFAFGASFGERQYLPEIVSSSHATFGERCENCHDHFQAVANGKCLSCHAPRIHAKAEVDTPACRTCHVEHRRAEVFLSVSQRFCVECHADLKTTGEAIGLTKTISGFSNHPELNPLRDGQKDKSALRFNHAIHLTSDKIPRDDKLECAKCHMPEADGRYMKPIVFEQHCERCHEQKVGELPYPIGDLKAPHEDPQAVREGLTEGLIVMAVLRRSELFQAPDIEIVGRVPRPPVDESRSLQEFQQKRLAQLEENLYRPFEDSPPLLESNKYCFLCHDQAKAADKGGLPEIAKTGIPHRWLQRGEFSHRKHDKVSCESCHGKVEDSKLTSDTNLPHREVCQRCHADGTEESAGTECMLCHVYHDTTKKPELRKPHEHEQSIEALLGTAALSAPQ